MKKHEILKRDALMARAAFERRLGEAVLAAGNEDDAEAFFKMSNETERKLDELIYRPLTLAERLQKMGGNLIRYFKSEQDSSNL